MDKKMLMEKIKKGVTVAAACAAVAVPAFAMSACGPETSADSGHTHDLEYHAAVAAKCETDGNYAYYLCKSCAHYFRDQDANQEFDANGWVIKAVGHSYPTALATPNNLATGETLARGVNKKYTKTCEHSGCTHQEEFTSQLVYGEAYVYSQDTNTPVPNGNKVPSTYDPATNTDTITFGADTTAVYVNKNSDNRTIDGYTFGVEVKVPAAVNPDKATVDGVKLSAFGGYFGANACGHKFHHGEPYNADGTMKYGHVHLYKVVSRTEAENFTGSTTTHTFDWDGDGKVDQTVKVVVGADVKFAAYGKVTPVTTDTLTVAHVDNLNENALYLENLTFGGELHQDRDGKYCVSVQLALPEVASKYSEALNVGVNKGDQPLKNIKHGQFIDGVLEIEFEVTAADARNTTLYTVNIWWLGTDQPLQQALQICLAADATFAPAE